MCDSGTHLSTGEETEAPKGGPTFLSSWILGFHATAMTSECIPPAGSGGWGWGLHKAVRQEATEEAVEAGAVGGKPHPVRTQDTEMEQGAGPQCDHLYPERLGSRMRGPAGPQCWKMGYGPIPRGLSSHFRASGLCQSRACLAWTRPHSMSPWKLPAPSPGRGGVMFKMLHACPIQMSTESLKPFPFICQIHYTCHQCCSPRMQVITHLSLNPCEFHSLGPRTWQ